MPLQAGESWKTCSVQIEAMLVALRQKGHKLAWQPSGGARLRPEERADRLTDDLGGSMSQPAGWLLGKSQIDDNNNRRLAGHVQAGLCAEVGQPLGECSASIRLLASFWLLQPAALAAYLARDQYCSSAGGDGSVAKGTGEQTATACCCCCCSRARARSWPPLDRPASGRSTAPERAHLADRAQLAKSWLPLRVHWNLPGRPLSSMDTKKVRSSAMACGQPVAGWGEIFGCH